MHTEYVDRMLKTIVEVKFMWKASGKVSHKSRESSVCETL